MDDRLDVHPIEHRPRIAAGSTVLMARLRINWIRRPDHVRIAHWRDIGSCPDVLTTPNHRIRQRSSHVLLVHECPVREVSAECPRSVRGVSAECPRTRLSLSGV